MSGTVPLQEGAASCRIQFLINVEHFTRHGGAGRFAPPRQQRAAKLDQPVGILFGVGRIAAQQRPAALGDGSKQIGEEGVSHLGLSKPGLCGAEAYTGFRRKPITIKQGIAASLVGLCMGVETGMCAGPRLP